MNENVIRILLIEDENFDVMRVKNTIEFFKDRIKIVSVVSNGDATIKLLSENPKSYDVIIMDYQIAGTLHGVELIKKIKEIEKTIQIIVITKLTLDITDLNFAKSLMKAGAFWYCTKYPNDIEKYIYQPTDFIMSIFNAYDRKQIEEARDKSNKKLDKQIAEILAKKRIISKSREMEVVKETIDKLAKSNATVLISGPSGTGKELVAYNIHYRSERKYEKFVPINCGSIPSDLIESELFGYEKGSFTGAKENKKGLFEIADNGTLFLDEIAELPLSAQVKLLRVIQEGEIDKIGRTDTVKVDVRIIAATNKDLRKEVEKGNFREDLYYRLNVLPINILPLSKRREDIEVLTNYLLEQYSFNMGIETPEITDEAMQKLTEHDWPGNVRELKNVIQRLLFFQDKKIDITDVEKAIIPAKNNTGVSDNLFSVDEIKPWKEFEKEVKYKYFKYVRENSASDAEAAAKLGLAPPNYYRMAKELGLK